MAVTNYAIGPIGVDFEVTQSVNDGTVPNNFKLGDVVIDNQGGHWIFGRADEALTAYSLCFITNATIILGTWKFQMAASADIATGPKFLGVNQVAFTDEYYGFIWRGPGGGAGRGIKVRSSNATNGALLSSTATDGLVDGTTIADEGVIAGLTVLVTTTTAAAQECQSSTFIACNLTEVD